MLTLHDRLRAELDRRLAVATAADGADWTLDERDDGGPKVGEWQREINYQMWHCEDELDGCPEIARGWIAEARLIAQEMAGAVRRYTGEIEVLERHAPTDRDARYGITCKGCPNSAAVWPCREFLLLASRLGVALDVDSPGTPG